MTLVEEIRERYIEKYKTFQYELESDYKEDEQRRTDYHGRELLELLQNGDDAAVNTTLNKVDVLLEYKDNVYIKRDPTTKLKAPKDEYRLPKSLSIEELEMLRESSDTVRQRVFLEVLYATGC
jgi:site-specific recombinase XerD